MFRFPAEAKGFVPHQSAQTGSGGHPTSYSINCTLLVPYIFDYTNLIQTNVHCFMLFNTTFY
jgi:hypothetical protein